MSKTTTTTDTPRAPTIPEELRAALERAPQVIRDWMAQRHGIAIVPRAAADSTAPPAAPAPSRSVTAAESLFELARQADETHDLILRAMKEAPKLFEMFKKSDGHKTMKYLPDDLWNNLAADALRYYPDEPAPPALAKWMARRRGERPAEAASPSAPAAQPAAQHAAQPAVHPADEDEVDTLWNYAEFLAECCKRHGAQEGLVKALEEAQYRDSDSAIPDPVKLAEAIRRFHALPQDEQQHLLGGWRPQPNRPHKRDVLAWLGRDSAEGIGRVLSVRQGREGRTFACQEWQIDGSIWPHIELRIQEGTRRQEVLEMLAEVTKAVEQHYDRWISDEQDAAELARGGLA